MKSSVIREVFGEGYAPVPKRKGMGFRLSKKEKKKTQTELTKESVREARGSKSYNSDTW